MDPDDSMRLGGFSLLHLAAAFILFGVLGFFIYLLWNGSCKKTDEEGQLLTPLSRRGDAQAMYALELEPGVVLLQSQDGENFRILHEYDAVKHRDQNPGPSSPGVSLQGQTSQYIPCYTRSHLQTHASAPQLPFSEDLMSAKGETLPPAYQ